MSNVRRVDQSAFIEGIPVFNRSAGINCEFIATLSTLLNFRGKEISLPYLLAMSGMAFRFIHNPVQKGKNRWCPGSYCITEMTENEEEALACTFEAVGYNYRIFGRESRKSATNALCELINIGEPTIILGGPESADFSLITGYEESGDILLGSSILGNAFRWGDWYDSRENGMLCYRGYIWLGEDREVPPAETLYLAALKRAVQLTKTSPINNLLNGLAALDVFAAEIRQKDFFPRDDKNTLWINYLAIQCNLMLLAHRRLAASFIEDTMELLPHFAWELLAARESYLGVEDLLGELETLVPGDFSAQSLSRLTDSRVRAEFADILLEIRNYEARAAESMESILYH